MATLTLRPNALGDEEYLHPGRGAGTNWQLVDEAEADDGTTKVWNDVLEAWSWDLYNLPAHGAATGVISKITFYFRVAAIDSATSMYAKPRLRSGGTSATGTQRTGTTTWTTFNEDFATNPVTAVAWTWSDIDALQIGVDLWNTHVDGNAACTQVYIVVTFTPDTTTVTPSTLALTTTTYAPTIVTQALPPTMLLVGQYIFYENRILDVKYIEHPDSFSGDILLDNSDLYFNNIALKGLHAMLYFRGKARAPLKIIDQEFRSSQGALTCVLSLIGIPNWLEADKASADYMVGGSDTNKAKGWLTAVLAGPNNTIAAMVGQGSGSGIIHLRTGTNNPAYHENYTAAGQVKTIDGTITKLGFKLAKYESPTGDITFTIRSWADQSLLGSEVWGDASTLSTDYAYCEVTFDPTITVNEEVFLGCEFSGGNPITPGPPVDGGDAVRMIYSTSNVIGEEIMATKQATYGWEECAGWDAVYYHDIPNFTVFNHCQAYSVVYDSEDSLIDTYQPKDSLTIKAGESRLHVCKKILEPTGCEMRPESDGKLHVLVPPVDESYTHSLASGHPFFSKVKKDGLIIPNKITIQSRDDDSSQYSGSATDATSYALIPIEAAPIKMLLESSAQATSIAEALISKLQAAKQVGAAEVPLISGGASHQLYDRILVTDTWENDSKEGNIQYLRFDYNPNRRQPLNLFFSFGTLATKKIMGTRVSQAIDVIRRSISTRPDGGVTWDALEAFLMPIFAIIYDEIELINVGLDIIDIRLEDLEE